MNNRLKTIGRCCMAVLVPFSVVSTVRYGSLRDADEPNGNMNRESCQGI